MCVCVCVCMCVCVCAYVNIYVGKIVVQFILAQTQDAVNWKLHLV